jgi:5-methylthioadenosine/S-adenosylhomocysteine deaminase
VTAIRNAVVVPIEPAGVVWDRGWVAFEGNRITGAGPGEPPSPWPSTDAGGALVMPGFVSAHQHLLDVLLRGGVRRGPSFLDWLLGLYYAGMTAYEPSDAGVATMLAGAETLRAGVTCVVDNWGVDCGGDPGRVRECAEASLASYEQIGLRVLFARMFATQLPEGWAASYDVRRLAAPLDVALPAIEDLMNAHDGRADGRIRVTPSPELAEMVSPEGLRAAAQLAASRGLVMPMHLLSTDVVSAATLDELGILSPNLLGAHCTAANADDISLLAARGVRIAHCPTSSAFGGLLPPLRLMLEAGLTMGLGSDNATLNNNSDILAEARRALLTARLQGAGSDLMTPRTALEMATIGGARAAGLDAEIGSLVPGKRADLIVLDTDAPHWFPRHDWYDALVLQAKSSDVRTVIVDGKTVVEDGGVLTVDMKRLGPDAQRASEGVLHRAGLGRA